MTPAPTRCLCQCTYLKTPVPNRVFDLDLTEEDVNSLLGVAGQELDERLLEGTAHLWKMMRRDDFRGHFRIVTSGGVTHVTVDKCST